MCTNTHTHMCTHRTMISVLGTPINAFHILIHLVLKVSLSGRYHYYLILQRRKQAQRGFDLPKSVQLLSHVWFFVTPWTAAHQASLSITNSLSTLKLMSIELVMPSNLFILCHPLLRLPSILPTIRVFSNELTLHFRWPKYWSFSYSISPSNEYSGLISFRIDWFDLFAVQVTLKSLLQHRSSKASVLQYSAFFMVQLSHSFMTSGKAIALLDRPLCGVPRPQIWPGVLGHPDQHPSHCAHGRESHKMKQREGVNPKAAWEHWQIQKRPWNL